MCPAPPVYLAGRLMGTVGLQSQLCRKMAYGFFGRFYSKAMFFFRKDVTLTFSGASSSCSSVTHLGLKKSTSCDQQLRCSHGQTRRPASGVRSRQVLEYPETRVHLYPAGFSALHPKCLRSMRASPASSPVALILQRVSRARALWQQVV